MTTSTSVPARRSLVRAVPAADPAIALAHFSQLLALETDPADLATDLATYDAGRVPGVTVLDVRSREAHAAGHVPGAVSLPHAEIDADVVARFDPDDVLVVYCWATGCNGADKGAARLAALGRRVKKLIGGYDHWAREGHAVAGGS